MQKKLLCVVLISQLLYPAHLLHEYGKDMQKVSALAAGVTLVGCGLYGMKHHFKAVKEGYTDFSKKLEEFSAQHKTCGSLIKFSYPLVFLGSGVFIARKSGSDYAFVPDKLWQEYQQDITKWLLLGGGVASGIWGLSGMGHYLDAVQEGYTWTSTKIVELQKNSKIVGLASRWALPVVALGTGAFALKLGLKK